ncbi:MAG: hypothetical protein M3Y57_18975 [Acidobacteriota bacterium]|nr:hypothetical protein [Acidobacteriota bacterium]
MKAMQTTADKQHAHALIDRLDSSLIATAVRFLEFIAMDPVARSIATTPVDDEPLTEGEDEALDRAEAWLKQNGGKGIPHEQVFAEFGLSMKNFPLT